MAANRASVLGVGYPSLLPIQRVTILLACSREAELAFSHFASSAHADDKIALVIGNSQYRFVPALTNPVNDAGDVAASLQRLGFKVKHLSDLD